MDKTTKIEEWLNTACPDEIFLSVSKSLESKLHPSSKGLFERAEKAIDLGTRRQVSEEILDHIRWYGTHSVRYRLRQAAKAIGLSDRDPSETYQVCALEAAQSLRENTLDRRFGTIFRKAVRVIPIKRGRQIAAEEKEISALPIGTPIKAIERRVCDLLVAQFLHDLTTEGLQEIVKGSKVQDIPDKQELERTVLAAGPGGGILALVNVIGKKAVTEIVLAVIYGIVKALLGEVAAKKFIEELLKRFPQYMFSGAIRFLGWAFNAWFVWGLFGPSMRCLLPSICLIACCRSMESIESRQS